MTDSLHRQIEALRLENAQLVRKAADAQQIMLAFARGEIDSVSQEASATPLLLHAAQEKLHNSRRLLRAIFEGAREPMVLTDAQGKFVDANPAACELYDLPLESLVGQGYAELGGVELLDQVSTGDFREQGHVRGTFTLQRADGTRRIMEFTSVSNVAPGVDLSVMRDMTDRVRAEEASRESRRRLEEAQAIAHIGSWTCGLSPEGTIEWSREGARIFGVAEHETMPLATFFETVHPEDRARVRKTMRFSFEHKQPADVEHRILRADGSTRWVHERGVVEEDTSGRPVRMVGTVQDVTDRHLALEAVRASESEFRLLAEAMPQIVWIAAPDGGNLYFNQRWVDYTGMSREDSLGERWTSCFHPDDKALAQQAWSEARALLGTYSVECRLRGADGLFRWWLIRGVPVKEANGTIVKWFGTFTDIDELKRVEARAVESETLLRVTGHAARLGGFRISLPERIVTWSNELCAMLEVPFGTIASFDKAMALHPFEFRDTIRSHIEACALTGTPFDIELQIMTASHRKIWVRAMGHAQRDSSGVMTGLFGAFQDVDERRKLQDQLRQNHKMEAIGRLAGGVAHDFNNIVSVIFGYSEFALSDPSLSPSLRADIEQIQTAGKRATDLTRQLLAFSRQQVLRPRVIDLNQIIKGMTSMLARMLGEDIELATLLSEHLGTVLADPGQLEQVIMNLTVNARDAMPTGGKITIETINLDNKASMRLMGDRPAECVLLTVSDTGIGMDASMTTQIFEPFYTTKERDKGTGLGLATVFGIVEQSGGRIFVESELGHGSSFKILLPRTDRTADFQSVLPQALVLAKGHETILLVEDDEQVRTVTCTILRRSGYQVLDASNGGEAFLISKDFPGAIHMLLSDVVMPRMNGPKLAQHLASERPDMKVLFVSGYTDDALKHHGVPHQDFAFLSKPITPHALLHKVREVLDLP